ncbi:MAG: PP2C family protein-serine/threonine phosphatase, partial [Bacteroidota bacterium]
LIIIPLAILIWKNKFKPARIFFFAFVFLLISVAVFVLKNAAILPSNTLTNYGLQMGSAIEVLLLTLAMIDKFNQFKTDAFKRLEEINTLKTEANLVLEKKVLERTKTINEQKEEILSSIRYAKRIQKNILPEKKLIHKLFEENAFVLYQPKDIVSGDFYWIEEIYLGDVKTQIVVVADCTGHGVPGGFMSMLGATLVRQEIKNLLPGDGPHQLLQKISNALQISIQNYENQEDWAITDGMDMAVVFIQEPNIKFAGAKSDLLIMFKNGEFQRVKGDKNSIAHEQANEFTLHSLTLSKGDSIYLFTDGIIDQFGGSENKKLSRSGLCKLISNTNENNFNQRENELLSKWNEWKEYNEQTDDMCLFAYKY